MDNHVAQLQKKLADAAARASFERKCASAAEQHLHDTILHKRASRTPSLVSSLDCSPSTSQGGDGPQGTHHSACPLPPWKDATARHSRGPGSLESSHNGSAATPPSNSRSSRPSWSGTGGRCDAPLLLQSRYSNDNGWELHGAREHPRGSVYVDDSAMRCQSSDGAASETSSVSPPSDKTLSYQDTPHQLASVAVFSPLGSGLLPLPPGEPSDQMPRRPQRSHGRVVQHPSFSWSPNLAFEPLSSAQATTKTSSQLAPPPIIPRLTADAAEHGSTTVSHVLPLSAQLAQLTHTVHSLRWQIRDVELCIQRGECSASSCDGDSHHTHNTSHPSTTGHGHMSSRYRHSSNALQDSGTPHALHEARVASSDPSSYAAVMGIHAQLLAELSQACDELERLIPTPSDSQQYNHQHLSLPLCGPSDNHQPYAGRQHCSKPLYGPSDSQLCSQPVCDPSDRQPCMNSLFGDLCSDTSDCSDSGTGPSPSMGTHTHTPASRTHMHAHAPAAPNVFAHAHKQTHTPAAPKAFTHRPAANNVQDPSMHSTAAAFTAQPLLLLQNVLFVEGSNDKHGWQAGGSPGRDVCNSASRSCGRPQPSSAAKVSPTTAAAAAAATAAAGPYGASASRIKGYSSRPTVGGSTSSTDHGATDRSITAASQHRSQHHRSSTTVRSTGPNSTPARGTRSAAPSLLPDPIEDSDTCSIAPSFYKTLEAESARYREALLREREAYGNLCQAMELEREQWESQCAKLRLQLLQASKPASSAVPNAKGHPFSTLSSSLSEGHPSLGSAHAAPTTEGPPSAPTRAPPVHTTPTTEVPPNAHAASATEGYLHSAHAASKVGHPSLGSAHAAPTTKRPPRTPTRAPPVHTTPSTEVPPSAHAASSMVGHPSLGSPHADPTPDSRPNRSVSTSTVESHPGSARAASNTLAHPSCLHAAPATEGHPSLGHGLLFSSPHKGGIHVDASAMVGTPLHPIHHALLSHRSGGEDCIMVGSPMHSRAPHDAAADGDTEDAVACTEEEMVPAGGPLNAHKHAPAPHVSVAEIHVAEAGGHVEHMAERHVGHVAEERVALAEGHVGHVAEGHMEPPAGPLEGAKPPAGPQEVHTHATSLLQCQLAACKYDGEALAASTAGSPAHCVSGLSLELALPYDGEPFGASHTEASMQCNSNSNSGINQHLQPEISATSGNASSATSGDARSATSGISNQGNQQPEASASATRRNDQHQHQQPGASMPCISNRGTDVIFGPQLQLSHTWACSYVSGDKTIRSPTSGHEIHQLVSQGGLQWSQEVSRPQNTPGSNRSSSSISWPKTSSDEIGLEATLIGSRSAGTSLPMAAEKSKGAPQLAGLSDECQSGKSSLTSWLKPSRVRWYALGAVLHGVNCYLLGDN